MFGHEDQKQLKERLREACQEYLTASEEGRAGDVTYTVPFIEVRNPEKSLEPLNIRSNTLIGGAGGSGKSVLLRNMFAAMAPRPDVSLIGVDLKGGLEMSSWTPRLSFLATRLEEVDFLLDKLAEENDRRMGYLRSIGQDRLVPSPEMPLIVVMVDELFLVVGSGVKSAKDSVALDRYELPQGDKSRQDKLCHLVSTGGSQGICFIVATRYLTADRIPTAFRLGFSQKAAFRLPRAIDVDVLFGPGSDEDAPAHLLPKGVPGMAFAETDFSDDVLMGRVPMVSMGDCADIANRESGKKQYFKWLLMPKRLYEDSLMADSLKAQSLNH